MSTFIERTVPPGDRDDAVPLLAGGSSDAAQPVAGRKPDTVLVPELDLHLPRIERALHDGHQAMADFMAARARGDWPAVSAAATRLAEALAVDLKALSAHVAKAVMNARAAKRR